MESRIHVGESFFHYHHHHHTNNSIANLDTTISQDQVFSLFLPFGPIIEVLLNQAKGFADIQYENIDDAESAIENMDGCEVFNKVLRVRKSIKEVEINVKKSGEYGGNYVCQVSNRFSMGAIVE